MFVNAILLGSRFTLYKVGLCLGLLEYFEGFKNGVVCDRGLLFAIGFVLFRCGFCNNRFEAVMLELVIRGFVVG